MLLPPSHTGGRYVAAGKQLVRRLVEAMRDREAEEVVLEAEVSNAGALALYEGLGFVRDKRLQRCAATSEHSAFSAWLGWRLE